MAAKKQTKKMKVKVTTMTSLLVLPLVQFEEGYFPEVVARHHDGHLFRLTAMLLRKQDLKHTHTHTQTYTKHV